MILLFLGLAVVLTTTPLLFIASSNGGGDDGGGDPATPKSTHPGEISGSVTITDKAEVWLTALIDEISILAYVEILGSESKWTGYRLSIVGVNVPIKSNEENPLYCAGTDSPMSPVVEFANPTEASNQIIQLLDNMGVPLSSESIQSVPHAIKFGWKSPSESKRIVNSLLESNSGA